jgi:nucleotide-binding universal stress UspA family protein
VIKLRRLLCPVDFSEPSRHALRYAIALARWYGSEVTVLYVEDAIQAAARAAVNLREPLLPTAEDAIRAFLDGPPRGNTTHIRVVMKSGEAVTGILEQAKGDSSDLIVMGTRGRSGLARILLGSVTDAVLRQASCPVMTIPQATHELTSQDLFAFDPILCPSDFSPVCHTALRVGVSVAQETDARLILLHALDLPTIDSGLMPLQPIIVDPIDRTGWRRKALARLKAGLSDDVAFRCHPEVLVVPGNPSETILRVAEENDVKLIVMGVHSRGAIDRMLFGSTTRQVIHAARWPVLSVRAKQGDEPWPAAPDFAHLPACTTA